MSDAAMQLAADQMADAKQLRNALAGLVAACRAYHDRDLEAALRTARQALDDTSHEGWMRRMRERHEARMAARFAECRANGRHLEVRWSSDTPPRCTHCERFVEGPII